MTNFEHIWRNRTGVVVTQANFTNFCGKPKPILKCGIPHHHQRQNDRQTSREDEDVKEGRFMRETKVKIYVKR